MNASTKLCQQVTPVEKSPTSSLPLTFDVTLPTLQEKTSHQIALTIWHNYIYSHSKADRVEIIPGEWLFNAFGIGKTYYDDCCKLIKSLEMPAKVEKDIKSAFNSIVYETDRWITHFHFSSFTYDLEEYWIKHFDINWCVWLPSGEIDYAKTASNMVSAPSLSPEQRFAVMSEFCMREEIENFPRHSLCHAFVSKVNFDRNSLIYYWICYLKNEFDEIPASGNYNNSIDAFMAAKCETYQSWSAFEYFWNRLGDDDQVSVVVNKLKNYYDTIFRYQQALIFSKMSSQQQNRVISEIPDITLLNFWICVNSPESAIWIWQHWKHQITPEGFRYIVRGVFTSKNHREDDMRLLLQVWRSASDQQRTEVVHVREIEITEYFFISAPICKSGIEFFFQFLSMKSPDSRRQMMIRNAGQFGSITGDLDSLNKIIQLCFPNVDDQLEYKRSIMKSEEMLKRCVELFNEVNFNDLLRKIKFYSGDASTSLDLVNRLLQSEDAEKLPYFTQVEKWNEFSKFIDDICCQDVTSALAFKKQSIKSYAQVCSHDWNDDECLDGADKILKMVFATEDELREVKKYFFVSYQKLFFENHFWEVFEAKYFNKFVLWCLNGDEKARDEFIKNLPVKDIVDGRFREFERWYNKWKEVNDYILEGLDKFLNWYFKGKDGARVQYKLRKLDSIVEKMEVFEESDLDIVLKWFFDSDEEGMLKFKMEKIKLGER